MNSKPLSLLSIGALAVVTGTACVYGAHSLAQVGKAPAPVTAAPMAQTYQAPARRVMTRCENARESLAAKLRVKAYSKKYWERRPGESGKEWRKRVRPNSAAWSADTDYLLKAKSDVRIFCR